MNSIVMGNLKSRTSWLATIVTTFGVLYDNWSQVAALIPPLYVGKAFSVLGIAMLVMRNLSKGSITDKAEPQTFDPVSKEGGFARVALLAVASVIMLILAACATLQSNEAIYKLGVDVAVGTVIKNTAPEKQARRIERIKLVAAGVRDLASGDAAVSIDGLQAAVNVQLAKLNLDAEAQQVANDLISAVVIELRKRVGEGVLKPDQRAQVAMVMGWVIHAAELAEKR